MTAFREAIELHTRSLGQLASQKLAQLAKDETAKILAAQKARRGIEPGLETAVDGDRGKSFDQVKPGGTIFDQFDYRREVVLACFDELRARSPRESGRYADSHYVMLDNVPLAPLTVPTQDQIDSVKRITITNPQPYSRKLEVALDRSGQPFVKQVEPHIFEGAMEATLRVYGAIAVINFAYINLEGAYVLKYDNAREAKRRRKVHGDHKAGAEIRYPAITIDRN